MKPELEIVGYICYTNKGIIFSETKKDDDYIPVYVKVSYCKTLTPKEFEVQLLKIALDTFKSESVK